MMQKYAHETYSYVIGTLSLLLMPLHVMAQKWKPVGGIARAHLHQTLTTYCFSTVFAYGLHLFPISLQKASFHGVKGYLSKDKKACIADLKGTFLNCYHYHTTQNDSANE